jgi:hypothetical protein
MYYLSIYAIFKNESHIINEWIRHYIEEGVEHFYLIDNGSTDNYEDQIEEFKDKITLFKDDTKYKQIVAYNEYILPEIHNTTWIIGADLDEFIWSTDGTIVDQLKTLEEIDPTIGLVQIPWEMFGSSGHIEQPKYVIPSFTKRIKYPENETDDFIINVKSIGKSEAIVEFDVHYFKIKEGYKSVDSLFKDRGVNPNGYISENMLKDAKLRLAHYPIQSYEWFKNVKMTRGDVATKDSDNVRDDTYFKNYDYNDIEDLKLYDKHSKIYSDLNTEIREDFVAPWNPTPIQIITKKVDIISLLFVLLLLIIIAIIIYIYL